MIYPEIKSSYLSAFRFLPELLKEGEKSKADIDTKPYRNFRAEIHAWPV
jgi:hypothetical protein